MVRKRKRRQKRKTGRLHRNVLCAVFRNARRVRYADLGSVPSDRSIADHMFTGGLMMKFLRWYWTWLTGPTEWEKNMTPEEREEWEMFKAGW
jgi:hypothetical protein